MKLGLAPIPSAAALTNLACMGNSLLDFVMALVRDPDAAARYAADPAAALAEAHLPGVTVADVQNLMPVVTDSLAMTSADFGAMVDVANVWTTGAAAAAFDAFDLPHPAPIAAPAAPQVISSPVDPALGMSDVPPHDPVPDVVLADQLSDPSPLEPPAQVWADDSGWQQAPDPQVADHHPTEHPGFDLF